MKMSKLAKKKKWGLGDEGRVFFQLVFVLGKGSVFVVLFSNCSGIKPCPRTFQKHMPSNKLQEVFNPFFSL